jgi:DNA (cytosine-5)-methyltransferase 1
MIGIDLFAGAGGMSLGARWAGIDVKVAVEANQHAAATYARNNPDVDCHLIDVRNFHQRIKRGRNDALVVFGGPPCQGFSTSNQRTRDRQNPRNWLFKEFLRIVEHNDPEWVVLENVSGLLQTEGGMFFHEIRSGLERLGFVVVHGVLSTTDFLIPQRRSRLFILGSRVVDAPVLPSSKCIESVTTWDAIGDLPELSNGASACCLPYRCEPLSPYASELRGGLDQCSNHLVTRNAPQVLERYHYVPQGGNWTNIPRELMSGYSFRTRCHTGIYHRLVARQPAKVIGNFRKNMLIHPVEHRGLSVREAARLQSFPDSYTFYGSIGFQQQQVGDAVPPRVAEAVFASILDQN